MVAATDDTVMQSKGKKKTPRKIDDKLAADDPMSTPASMSIHDAVGEPYSNMLLLSPEKNEEPVMACASYLTDLARVCYFGWASYYVGFRVNG